MSNIFAEFLQDAIKVVRSEHEIACDEIQIAGDDGDQETALKLEGRIQALEDVLWILECDYPEDLYERYGELLEAEKSNEL